MASDVIEYVLVFQNEVEGVILSKTNLKNCMVYDQNIIFKSLS